MRRLATGDSDDTIRIHHEIRWPCGTQLRRQSFTEFVGCKGDIRAMCLTYSICSWTRSVLDVSGDTKLLALCLFVSTTLLSPIMSLTPSHFLITQTNLYHLLVTYDTPLRSGVNKGGSVSAPQNCHLRAG